VSVEQFESQVLELAVRRVRTPEGAQFYGLPIGAPITKDIIDAKNAEAAAQGLTPPQGAISSGSAAGGFMSQGTISGKAASEKNAPKPAEKPKLKLKIKKSTLTGNKHFSIGKAKYTAPNGSKLIRPASQPGMAYVVTPDGSVHAFNEAGEIEIPKTLTAVFQNKFGPDFEGDENYSVEEFEATSGSVSLNALKVGATLVDSRGTPQFKKLADDTWEHVDLGVRLKDADLQDLYDSGDLVPDTSDDDISVVEETFANTEAMNFGEMNFEEALQALEGLPEGVTVMVADRPFVKNSEGTFDGQDEGTTQGVSADNLAHLKSILSIGAPEEPEYNPLDGKSVNPLDGEAASKPAPVSVGDTPTNDWIDKALPGAQVTYTSPAGNKTNWTKDKEGDAWTNQFGGQLDAESFKSAIAVNNSDVKIAKEGKEPKAPAGSPLDGGDSSAPQESTEQPDLSALGPDLSEADTKELLDAAEVGHVIHQTNGDREFTKREDGDWDSSTGVVVSTNALLAAIGPEGLADGPQPEQPSPAPAKPKRPKPKDISAINGNSNVAEVQRLLDSAEVGHQIYMVDSEATLTKNEDGTWKSSKTGNDLTSENVAILAPDIGDGPAPELPKRDKPRSTSKLVPGEGDYTELATPGHMQVSTIGDRVLVAFDNGAMVSEYELTDSGDGLAIWSNVDDDEDWFGQVAMNAMVVDGGAEKVYIHATKQSKPLPPEVDEDEPNVNSTDLIWHEDMAPLDILSEESPHYLFPGDYDYTAEATQDDITNAQPGDKILIGYDPDFEENTADGDAPHYEAADLVEKQPDGSWKNLTHPQAGVTEEDLMTAVMASEGEYQPEQLYAFKGNSTKQQPQEAPAADKPLAEMTDVEFSTALVNAPVGSKLIPEEGQVPFRKQENGTWTQGGKKKPVSHGVMYAMRDQLTLVTPTGTQEPEQPADPGEPISGFSPIFNSPDLTVDQKRNHLAIAPTGAQVNLDGVTLTKQSNGQWLSWANGNTYSNEELAQYGAALTAGPAPATQEPIPSHGLITDEGAKKIGGQSGSNPGGLYELPTPDGPAKYYVKKPQTADHGNNEALANALYRELGVNAPEVDVASDGQIYSKIVDGKQDMQARLNDQVWLSKVRRDFAIDAWLANWDVFGLSWDNVLTDKDGNPWRIDNGGALKYRAMGSAKGSDFGPSVTELESYRTGKKAAVFGSDMTYAEELDGAQRIVNLSPERIQEMVSEYGMDESMANTLLARRKYIAEHYSLPLPEESPHLVPDQTSESEAPATDDDLPEGVPTNAVLVNKDIVTHAPKPGDQIFEVTGKGKIITYTKAQDGDEWSALLPSGLDGGMLTLNDIFFAPGGNKHYYVPAPLQSQSAEEQAPWEWGEGHTITSVEDLESLLPGTKLEYTKKDGSKTYYTKLDNGAFLTPGGNVYAASQLSGSAKSQKFTVFSLPALEPNVPSPSEVNEFGYAEGDAITKMAHVNAFPVGQRLAMFDQAGNFLNFVDKTEEGWKAPADDPKWPNLAFTPGDMGDAVAAGNLRYVAPKAPESSFGAKDKQLWPGAPAMSSIQIAEAYKALEEHSSFHVSYGLKALPDSNPLKSAENQESLKVAALNKYPDLKAKPAVIKYLKDSIGIEEGTSVEEENAPKVWIGSKTPKSTGVQGMDGGEFTMSQVQQAIDILESFQGKNFKSELNKKMNALGSLNPNSIVGFDKDKTVTKQKFIDLLKAKLVRTETDIQHPKVKSLEELSGLPVGTVVRWQGTGGIPHTYTKISAAQWTDDGSGNVLGEDSFSGAIDNGFLRIESKPDVLPDYAKTPPALQDKQQEELSKDDGDFSLKVVQDAPVGTKAQNGAPGTDFQMVAVKEGEDHWTIYDAKTGDNLSDNGFGFMNDSEMFNAMQGDWDFSPVENPTLNENPEIVPGKYSSPGGKAYMVVAADGTGVYVNTKGGVSKLTAKAVKTNYDKGMKEYHGMPDDIPSPTAKAAPKKPVVVSDLTPGTYFAGSPQNPKTAVYEVSTDTAKIFKPKTDVTAMTGVKIGGYPTTDWLNAAGVGAKYEVTSSHYEDGEYVQPYEATKHSDGKWHFTDPKTGEEVKPPEEQPNIWATYYSHVLSHGLQDPVEFDKKKVNTLFSKGQLTDKFGMSVLPEGYTGSVFFFGSQTTVPSLMQARQYLDTVTDESAYAMGEKLKSLGVFWQQPLWVKWRAENGFTENTPENAVQALKEAMDGLLSGVDTSTPEANAADLFEWNEMGYAKFPASVAALTVNSYDKNSLGSYIKAASASIGDGKIIGQHLTKMDKWERQKWVAAFKKGDFKALYQIEVSAAAKEGKAHNSGYLHPGYEGSEATHQITWGPAVEGEIPAGEPVEGNWTSPGIEPSLPEIQNYLIKAQMQNPTFLSNAEKRQWVLAHKQGQKEKVDQLSALAQVRKQNGDAALSDAPTWTDDVQPAKSYDHVFENNPDTPWPQGSIWKATPYDVTTDWAKDHFQDPDFKEFYSNYDTSVGGLEWDPSNTDYSTKYKSEEIVAAYFDAKHAAYLEELNKPKYFKVEQIDKGSHEVWLVKDQFDRKYIFKPWNSEDQKARAQMEHKANELARMWGFQSAKTVMATTEDGHEGLIQNFVDNVGSFAGNGDGEIQMETLNEKQLAAIAAEHVLDWALDNDDTHPDNLLMTPSGGVVGIDKGRAFFVYGNWNGISGDASAHTNATLVYTQLYDKIRNGTIDYETAVKAYQGARKAASRIQKSDDAAAEQMVREAVEFRTNWDVPDYMTHFTHRNAPANADQLVKAFLHRKSKLVEQIDQMWDKIFQDAGFGGLPEEPPTVFEEHISGWDEPGVLDKAAETKVWGAAPLHGSASIHNGHSLLWTEQNETGEELHKGQITLGDLAQNKLLAFLQPKAQQVQVNSVNTQPIYLNQAQFPTTNDWKSTITAAGKNVTKNSVDKEYDPDIISAFNSLEQTLLADAAFWKPDLEPEGNADYVEFPSGKRVAPEYLSQYKMMLDHYFTQIGKVKTAISEGGTTNKGDFTVFQGLAPKVEGRIIVSPDGITYTELANGQWLSSKGSEVSVGALPVDPNALPDGWTNNVEAEPQEAVKEVLYTVQSAAGKGGTLNEGGLKVENSKDEGTSGHTGKEYRITLPSGEVIFFRNSTSTNTARSQRGTVSFRLVGPDKEASLARVQSQLELMGLDLTGADETQAELNYWRAMWERVIFTYAESSAPATVKSALKKLKDKKQTVKGPNGENLTDWTLIEGIGLSMSDTEELAFYRSISEEAWGKDRVDSFIAQGKHMPKFNHMDLANPELATGKPYYERIDVDLEQVLKKGHMVAIGNNGKDDSLLRYITSGGMLSTEERLRILGYFKQGASSGSDQGTGGANSVFTRIAHTGASVEFSGSIYGKHVAYWNPSVFTQVDTYSFSGDRFGDRTDQQSQNKYDPLKALTSFTGSSNETMVPNAMSILDHLEIFVFDNAEKRNEAIQRMKALGFAMLRGLPIEDRFVMRVNLQAAIAKVKAQWTK